MQETKVDNPGHVPEKIVLLSELSRHYDSTLWTVTSIWAAALGGLLVFCVQTPNTGLTVLGLLFTACPMFFARGFREIRKRVHEAIRNLSQEIAELHVSHTAIHQWDAFCVIFLGLAVSWASLLFSRAPDLCWLWTVLSLSVVLVIGVVWKISRGDTRL